MFRSKMILLLNFIAICTSVRGYMIPYYLGNTLIMIDSQDYNLHGDRESSVSSDNKFRMDSVSLQNQNLKNYNPPEVEHISSNNFDSAENELEHDGVIDGLRKGENYLNVGSTDKKDQFLGENEQEDLVYHSSDAVIDPPSGGDFKPEEYKEEIVKGDTVSVELKINDPRETAITENEIERKDENYKGSPDKKDDKIIVKEHLNLEVEDKDKERNFLYIPLPASILESIQRQKSEMKEQEKESQQDINTSLTLSQEKEIMKQSAEKPTVEKTQENEHKAEIEPAKLQNAENEKIKTDIQVEKVIIPGKQGQPLTTIKEIMKQSAEKPTVDEKILENEHKAEIEPVKLQNAENEKIKTDIQVEKVIIPGKQGQPSTTLLYLHSPGVKKNIKKSNLEDLNLEHLSEAPAVQTNNIHDFLRLKSQWDRIHNAKQKSES